MKKIKITEQQAIILKGLYDSKKGTIVKISKEQFDRVFSKKQINEYFSQDEYPVIFSNTNTGEYIIGTAEKIGDKIYPRSFGRKFNNLNSSCKYYLTNKENIVGQLSETILNEYSSEHLRIVNVDKECNGIDEELINVDQTFKKIFNNTPSKTFRNTHDETGKKFKPVSENNNDKELLDFTKHVIGFLKDIIGSQSEKELSYYWRNLGIDKNTLCDMMTNSGLISSMDNGGYNVIKANFANNIKNLYGEIVTKPENELVDEDDMNAPQNQPDVMINKPIDPKYKPLHLQSYNSEVAIFADDHHKLFVFYYEHLNKNVFKDYAEMTKHVVGKDAEGHPEFEYSDDWDIDGNILSRYVNDNLGELSKGKGIIGFESGKDLVLIDDELKTELLDLYDKDKKLKKSLGVIDETTSASSSGQFTGPMGGESVINKNTPEDVLNNVVDEESNKEDIKHQLSNQLKDKSEAIPKSKEEIENELARRRAAEIKRRETDEIDEVTVAGASADGGSSGPYVGPAFLAKNPKNSRFSHKTMYPNGKMVKDPMSESDNTTKTSYPKGEFVEFDDCVRLNNNKKAENGGCSTGAIDNVVKTKSTSGSVISKDAIYYEVAKQTGKTIEEVKKIIDNDLFESIAKQTGKSIDDVKKIIKNHNNPIIINEGIVKIPKTLISIIKTTNEFIKRSNESDIPGIEPNSTFESEYQFLPIELKNMKIIIKYKEVYGNKLETQVYSIVKALNDEYYMAELKHTLKWVIKAIKKGILAHDKIDKKNDNM